jgi:hypothetical protein
VHNHKECSWEPEGSHAALFKLLKTIELRGTCRCLITTLLTVQQDI